MPPVHTSGGFSWSRASCFSFRARPSRRRSVLPKAGSSMQSIFQGSPAAVPRSSISTSPNIHINARPGYPGQYRIAPLRSSKLRSHPVGGMSWMSWRTSARVSIPPAPLSSKIASSSARLSHASSKLMYCSVGFSAVQDATMSSLRSIRGWVPVRSIRTSAAARRSRLSPAMVGNAFWVRRL